MLLLALGVAAFLSAAMTFAWRVALVTGQSGRIDAIWSLATGLAAFVAALWPSPDASLARQILVAGFAAIWSLRLGLYLWRRAVSSEDDPRYAALKAEWGDDAPRKLLMFLQAQAVCALPLALAAYVAAHAPRGGLDGLDFLGVAVFCVALAGEALADRQMARFRENPANRGRICDIGLWAWSRHPNYFFEWLVWLAYPLVAFGLSSPAWLLTLAAPAVMYWLLVHVSGLPPLEAHLKRSRPEAFARYAARVNAFWPRPPKV